MWGNIDFKSHMSQPAPTPAPVISHEDPKLQEMAGKIVGHFSATEIATGKPIQGFITKEKIKGHEYYRAYVGTEHSPINVGFLEMYRAKRQKNDHFGSAHNQTKIAPPREGVIYRSTNYYPDAAHEKGQLFQENYVFVNEIESQARKTYKGIGSALLQVAIETAQKPKYAGRIKLEAVRDSHVFYHKLGFQTSSSMYTDKIVSLIKDPTRENRNLGSIEMHLDKEGREKWKEKIQNERILDVNRSKEE